MCGGKGTTELLKKDGKKRKKNGEKRREMVDQMMMIEYRGRMEI